MSAQYFRLYERWVSLTETVCWAKSMMYVLGADRFLTDIELMLGTRPSNVWKYSWKFVAPVALLVRVLTKIGRFSNMDWIEAYSIYLCQMNKCVFHLLQVMIYGYCAYLNPPLWFSFPIGEEFHNIMAVIFWTPSPEEYDFIKRVHYSIIYGIIFRIKLEIREDSIIYWTHPQ